MLYQIAIQRRNTSTGPSGGRMPSMSLGGGGNAPEKNLDSVSRSAIQKHFYTEFLDGYLKRRQFYMA